MTFAVIELTPDSRQEWEPLIRSMERGIVYPLGDDSFEIDHGEDYFAFFERMGELRYFIAHRSAEVAGVAAFVQRSIPDREDVERPVWYACDFKVAPGHRGSRVARVLLRATRASLSDEARGYGISMDPPPPGKNKVVSMLRRASPLQVEDSLCFYSLEAATVRQHRSLLSEHLGPFGFLSHSGRKDIVLKSTGQPMPLLHLQFGPLAASDREEPEAGAVHMFCLPVAHPLHGPLQQAGVKPHATATVLANHMHGYDFTFVLTSDI